MHPEVLYSKLLHATDEREVHITYMYLGQGRSTETSTLRSACIHIYIPDTIFTLGTQDRAGGLLGEPWSMIDVLGPANPLLRDSCLTKGNHFLIPFHRLLESTGRE
jgi:hypothetical protein